MAAFVWRNNGTPEDCGAYSASKSPGASHKGKWQDCEGVSLSFGRRVAGNSSHMSDCGTLWRVVLMENDSWLLLVSFGGLSSPHSFARSFLLFPTVSASLVKCLVHQAIIIILVITTILIISVFGLQRATRHPTNLAVTSTHLASNGASDIGASGTTQAPEPTLSVRPNFSDPRGRIIFKKDYLFSNTILDTVIPYASWSGAD